MKHRDREARASLLDTDTYHVLEQSLFRRTGRVTLFAGARNNGFLESSHFVSLYARPTWTCRGNKDLRISRYPKALRSSRFHHGHRFVIIVVIVVIEIVVSGQSKMKRLNQGGCVGNCCVVMLGIGDGNERLIPTALHVTGREIGLRLLKKEGCPCQQQQQQQQQQSQQRSRHDILPLEM